MPWAGLRVQRGLPACPVVKGERHEIISHAGRFPSVLADLVPTFLGPALASRARSAGARALSCPRGLASGELGEGMRERKREVGALVLRTGRLSSSANITVPLGQPVPSSLDPNYRWLPLGFGIYEWYRAPHY